MELGLKMSKAEHEGEIDATTYRKNIGCLRYLLHTRPDLSFSVGVLSRYMQNPRESHGIAMKHVFRYLQGTIDLGLFYPKNINGEMVGFADARYLSDPHKARSQTGYVFTVGGTIIS